MMDTFINEFVGMPPVYLPDIGPSEIIDIIIVATLLYYIMRWIRQTHAWALLKGIVIFSLVAAGAYILDLVTVMWVVQNAFAMGLIALVILFQPEMRKALEQLGKGVDLAGLSGSELKGHLRPQYTDEIVQAALSMASRRVGALICVEREVSLADLEKTGVAIDGLVTRQLLENIFTDRTPLHDGAVVIRNNRLTAASCILPLTTEEIGKELGTRHRAAVGASEVSDALILVVSEETGAISLAAEGALAKNLTEKELRMKLNIEGETAPKRRLIPWKNRKNLF